MPEAATVGDMPEATAATETAPEPAPGPAPGPETEFEVLTKLVQAATPEHLEKALAAAREHGEMPVLEQVLAAYGTAPTRRPTCPLTPGKVGVSVHTQWNLGSLPPEVVHLPRRPQKEPTQTPKAE